VEDSTYGPFGIGRRDDGKVVMVHGGVPGDVVEVVGTRETASLVEARIESLVTPSPHRISPVCPAFPACGGCSWLHIRRDAQLKFKRTNLCHTLRHLLPPARVPAVIAAGPETGYRQRARLHLDGRAGEPPSLGFFAHGTHHIVPVESCPVCVPALDETIGSLARLALPLPFAGTMEFVTTDAGRVLAALFLSHPHPAPRELARLMVEKSSLAGITVAAPDRGKAAWGESHGRLTVMDDPHCTIPIFPAAFCQANAAVNKRLVTTVVETLGDAAPGGRILELYAGHGNFTYPLAAHGHELTAVETGLNPALLPQSDNVRFVRQDVRGFLRREGRGKGTFDAVLLDPPRAGARAVMGHIIDLNPPRVIYVSCEPNTFARDARVLTRGGFRLEKLVAFDMMPQTFHVELMGLFVSPA